MSLTATQLSALSRLFSASVLREMAGKGYSPLFARLLVDTDLMTRMSLAMTEDVKAVYEAAFAVLSQLGLRDEYVYRAALTHKVLLGVHSLNTASMLTEFRVGASRADVVILNGTSTVYEIKSERDSLARLASQLINYRKVFAKIYVIAAESHVQDVLENTSADIGVLSLGRRGQISTKRETIERPDLVCPVAIFESLRSAEAAAILRSLKIPVPDVPNTRLHGAMRECFVRLDPGSVHQQMVQTLKNTRKLVSLRSLMDQMPQSLQPAVLTTQFRRSDHQRLISAINTPLNEALNWA
jgi:hypothetical protein